jgi:ketosteroid isomerase-like protein
MDGEVPLVQGPSGGAAGDADRSAEETARGVFAAIDAHDLEAIAGFFHPDDVQEFVPIGVFSGRQAVLGVFAELFRAFPDLRMEIEHVMADERGPTCAGGPSAPSAAPRTREFSPRAGLWRCAASTDTSKSSTG